MEFAIFFTFCDNISYWVSFNDIFHRPSIENQISKHVFAARNCCAIVAKKWFPLFTPNNSIFRSVRGNQSQTMLP